MDLPKEIQEQLDRIEKAVEESNKLPDGLQIGKLLPMPVADGNAIYEITKITKRTVTLKWREDLTLDSYQEPVLGEGGTFPRKHIEPLIVSRDVLRQWFKKKEK